MMNSFSRIELGLYLPSRQVLIGWGAKRDDLAAGADEARDWLPHGHKEKYGQIHWRGECCLPFQEEEKMWDGLDGSVIAYIKGDPLTVRSFGVFAWDRSYHREPVFQYALWMQKLSKQFGSPEVPTKDLAAGFHIVPPCIWKAGAVTVGMSYVYFKGDPYLETRISHRDFPL